MGKNKAIVSPKRGKKTNKTSTTTTPKIDLTPKTKTRVSGRVKGFSGEGTPDSAKPAEAKKIPPVAIKAKSSESSDEDEEFEVRRILDSRMEQGGDKLEYLIHWKGYKKDESTWEPVSSLENCPELLQKYLNKINQKSLVQSRSLGLGTRRSTRKSTRRSETEAKLTKIKSGKVEKKSTPGSTKAEIQNKSNFKTFNYKKAILTGMIVTLTVGSAFFIKNVIPQMSEF